MRAALLMFALGAGFTAGIAPLAFDWTAWDVARALLATNAAGGLAMLVALGGERQPWIRRHVLTNGNRVWAIFVGTYFGCLLWLAPKLQSLWPFLTLTFALIVSTGPVILIFGPIRDWTVRWEQRRGMRPPARIVGTTRSRLLSRK